MATGRTNQAKEEEDLQKGTLYQLYVRRHRKGPIQSDRVIVVLCVNYLEFKFQVYQKVLSSYMKNRKYS